MEDAADYTKAFIEHFVSTLFHTLLAADLAPSGSAWKPRCISIDPEPKFNAQVQQAAGLPWYTYKIGAAISILDVCNVLCADAAFFPEIGTEEIKPQSPDVQQSPGRFIEYPMVDDELSVPVLDFSSDNRRWSLFDHIYTMACRYLALHEQAHFFLGHLGYLRKHGRGSRSIWFEVDDESTSGLPPVVSRAMELQADRYAFDLLFQSGLRLRDAPPDDDGPFEHIRSFDEWLIKSAVGSLIICGILELSQQYRAIPISERTHPSAAARSIALITSLRYVMVEHIESTVRADEILIAVVTNAQRIYAVLKVPSLAENAMLAWMNRDRISNSAMDEYREAAGILRSIRAQLSPFSIQAHRKFRVTPPAVEGVLLIE